MSTEPDYARDRRLIEGIGSAVADLLDACREARNAGLEMSYHFEWEERPLPVIRISAARSFDCVPPST